MINVIVTSLLILLLFILGHVTQAFKKLFGLLAKIFLSIANLFGVKIITKEHGVKISNEFKEVYKGIKKVKMSNKNIKNKSSIDWIYFSLFVISLILIVINLQVVTGKNLISDFIYNLIKPLGFIKDPSSMNVTYTAVLFSCLSFSLSKLMQRWKETKQDRIERKQLKIKLKALEYMDSKELLDNAKKKDEENRKELEK